MACPDEDTFARFVEGVLPPREATAIEQHVDGCARCADLAAAFGRLYAPIPAVPAARGGERLVQTALVFSAVFHVGWAVVVARAAAALAGLAPAGVAAASRGGSTPSTKRAKVSSSGQAMGGAGLSHRKDARATPGSRDAL